MPRIETVMDPSAAELEPLRQKFWQFVRERLPGLPPESEDRRFLFRAIGDRDNLIGGISGSVYWDGLEIDILWVDGAHRGQGLGTALLEPAETWAREQGAVIAFLRTVEASDFYLDRGYQLHGLLEDRPRGTRLYHMNKRLDDRPGN